MDIVSLIIFAVFIVMIVLMFRANSKRAQQLKKTQDSLTYGTKVITQSGITGSVVEINKDRGEIVLETYPGSYITVMSATIINILSDLSPHDDNSIAEEGDEPDSSENNAQNNNQDETELPPLEDEDGNPKYGKRK